MPQSVAIATLEALDAALAQKGLFLLELPDGSADRTRRTNSYTTPRDTIAERKAGQLLAKMQKNKGGRLSKNWSHAATGPQASAHRAST